MLLGCGLACACAREPDTTASPGARPSADASAPTSLDAGASASADGGRAFGLPMPQQFPHFVWDAAAADASAH